MDNMRTQDVITNPPTDMQAPEMYQAAVWLAGGITALVVIVLGGLMLLGKPVEPVITGLVAIGSLGMQAIGQLLARRS